MLLFCVFAVRRQERESFKAACMVRATCVFHVEVARIRFEKAAKATATAAEMLDEEHQARLQYSDQEKQRQKDALHDAIKKQKEMLKYMKACEGALQQSDEECERAKCRFRSSIFLDCEFSEDDSD